MLWNEVNAMAKRLLWDEMNAMESATTLKKE